MGLVSFLPYPLKRGGGVTTVISTLDALGGQAAFCKVGVPLLGISEVYSAQPL